MGVIAVMRHPGHEAAAVVCALFPLLASADYSVECSRCSGRLNRFYTMNHAQSEDLRRTLGEYSRCFEARARVLGLSPTDVRNVFEVTGRVISQADLDENAGKLDAMRLKQDTIVRAVKSGRPLYRWPDGASDCETHADRLAAHLRDALRPQTDYVVEKVNSWPDIDVNDVAVNPIPMANHFVVRVIHLPTGLSYIADGYLGVSVKREADLEARHERVIMNDYESCFYCEVASARLSETFNPCTSFLGLLPAATPGYRSVLAQDAKYAARQCLSGDERVLIRSMLDH